MHNTHSKRGTAMKHNTVVSLLAVLMLAICTPVLSQNQSFYIGKLGNTASFDDYTAKAFTYTASSGAVTLEPITTFGFDAIDLCIEAQDTVKIDSIVAVRKSRNAGTRQDKQFGPKVASGSYGSWTSVVTAGAVKYFNIATDSAELGPYTQFILYMATTGNPTGTNTTKKLFVSVKGQKKNSNVLAYLPKAGVNYSSFDLTDAKWFNYYNSSGTVYTVPFRTGDFDSLDVMIECDSVISLTSIKATRKSKTVGTLREIGATASVSEFAATATWVSTVATGAVNYFTIPGATELGPWGELQIIFAGSGNPVGAATSKCLVALVGRKRP